MYWSRAILSVLIAISIDSVSCLPVTSSPLKQSTASEIGAPRTGLHEGQTHTQQDVLPAPRLSSDEIHFNPDAAMPRPAQQEGLPQDLSADHMFLIKSGETKPVTEYEKAYALVRPAQDRLEDKDYFASVDLVIEATQLDGRLNAARKLKLSSLPQIEADYRALIERMPAGLQPAYTKVLETPPVFA